METRFSSGRGGWRLMGAATLALALLASCGREGGDGGGCAGRTGSRSQESTRSVVPEMGAPDCDLSGEWRLVWQVDADVPADLVETPRHIPHSLVVSIEPDGDGDLSASSPNGDLGLEFRRASRICGAMVKFTVVGGGNYFESLTLRLRGSEEKLWGTGRFLGTGNLTVSATGTRR